MDAMHKDKDHENCPFCEQTLEQKALELIKNYSAYLENEENKTISRLKNHQTNIKQFTTHLTQVNAENLKRSNQFGQYTSDYFASHKDKALGQLPIDELNTKMDDLCKNLNEKMDDISQKIQTDHSLPKSAEKLLQPVNAVIENNNKIIADINKTKNTAKNESLKIRKDLCASVFNSLIQTHKDTIKTIQNLEQKIEHLNTRITSKKGKTQKREKVASTIKKVLQMFFDQKYKLDETTFRLTFQKHTLDKGQAKDVLSEGEKNIIAFAYWLGDTHLKIKDETDYQKLFFVIDDPISSMDFNHVYTLCRAINDLDKIIPEINQQKGNKRLLILTHSNEFMRLLLNTNAADTALLLKDGKLLEFNHNLTAPYIHHLLDVYKIAKENGTPNHTTANSIRHIIETVMKFEIMDTKPDSLKKYIEKNMPGNQAAYNIVNDLSHGVLRDEQAPTKEEDYKKMCEAVVGMIEKKFKGQIDYCKKLQQNETRAQQK